MSDENLSENFNLDLSNPVIEAEQNLSRAPRESGASESLKEKYRISQQPNPLGEVQETPRRERENVNADISNHGVTGPKN